MLLVDPHWDAAPRMSDPSVAAPANNTHVYFGQNVQCVANRATDRDTWYDEEGEPTEYDDEMIEDDGVYWVDEGGMGSWLGDDDHGATVTWIAPWVSGSPVLTVHDNDIPANRRAEVEWPRDDEPEVTAGVQVHIVYVTHVEYYDPVEEQYVPIADCEDWYEWLYLPKGTEAEFRAVHNAGWGVTGWPAGKPVWDDDIPEPSIGETRQVTWTATGEKWIVAGCGNTVAGRVRVIGLQAIEYQHPELGWTVISNPDTNGTIYLPTGTTMKFRAKRDPEGTAWPRDCPEWYLGEELQENGEDPALQEVTFSQAGPYHLSAWCGDEFVVHIKVFNPTVEVTAYARDGTTALGNKVTVGAFVRLNEDDDDADGGGAVQDKDDPDVRLGDGTPKEDDLIRVHLDLADEFARLTTGLVVLKRDSENIRVWKSPYKGGAGNEMVFNEAANKEKRYNLSQAAGRQAFASDVRDTDVWVEGWIASDGLKDTGISLIYRNAAGNTVSSDLVKFTVIRTLITVCGSDETTAVRLDRKEDPGAYVWYNRDDDDGNDTEDRDDLTAYVNGEDDLLKTTLAFNAFFEGLQSGTVVIEREDERLRLWKQKQKGPGQQIAFDSNRRAYDLSQPSQKNAFTADIYGHTLWLEGYAVSAAPRDTGLTLIYEDPAGHEVCRERINATVLRLEATAMSFNHDRSDTSDAVNLRRDGTANGKIYAPEWRVDGTDLGTEPDSCDAVLYFRNTARPAIHVDFAITPHLNSARVRAVGLRASLGGSAVLSMGDLGDARDTWHTLTFASGAVDGVVFTATDTAANCVLREEARFQWEANELGGVTVPPFKFTLAGQGKPIMIYTILDRVDSPWNIRDTAGADPEQPWACVLEYATRNIYRGVQWGMGATDVNTIADRITWAINQCGRYEYLEATYTRVDTAGQWWFKVGIFTNQLAGPVPGTHWVNCHDVSLAVVAYSNILGSGLSRMYLGPPLGDPDFTTNPICSIGPVGADVNVDANWRTWDWLNHGVAWRGPDADTSAVYDGCAHVDSDGDPAAQPPRTPELPRNSVFTIYRGRLGGNPRRVGLVPFRIE
jgi:hypothetical protein